MILGLDISTNTVGITVMKEDQELILSEALRFKKNLSLTARCLQLKEFIKQLDHKFKCIFIEEPFSMFSGGRTTAHTMAKLQRFNGMCSFMVAELCNLEPILIPANKARKAVGITIKRGTCTKTKVIDFVKKTYPSFQIWYTRHGNPKPGTDDRADSVVVALAGLILGAN
tara:strand:- start:217 stop:726 length:510 start_codon:yes stop_codon:yes gene_type:complete